MPLLKADGVQPRAASSFLRRYLYVVKGCICFSYFFPLFYSSRDPASPRRADVARLIR